MVYLLFVLEVAISGTVLLVAHYSMVSLLGLGPKEANHFYEHDDHEEEDGPRNEYHYYSVSDIIVFKIEGGSGVICCRRV